MVEYSPTENLRTFGIILIIAQVIVIVLYGVFVRFSINSGTGLNEKYYPFYQDVNVMMLIGFGFLMTFVRRHSMSALAYTFFLNAVIVQYYILLSAFWTRVFLDGFNANTYFINIYEKSFTLASYSVASILIAFGAVLGRVGPLQLLIMGLVQIIGYTLNQALMYEVIKVFDVGGSMAIHTFGAYFGLTVSYMLCRTAAPVGKVPTTYNSNAFAFIGTLFLWMFWPSFNAGYFTTTDYQKTQVIANTILSLTASCLCTFIVTSLNKHKLEVQDLLNATLAGGVIIGAPAGVIYNPAAALIIGAIGGVVSTFGYHYLTEKLKEVGIYDTSGIHNLHGMPGILGGILSAVVIAVYNSFQIIDVAVTSTTYLPFYASIVSSGSTFFRQGGLQIAGVVCSLVLAIIFGIIAGLIINTFYDLKPQHFYRDEVYFELGQESTVHFDETLAQVKKAEQLNDTLVQLKQKNV